MTAQTGETRRDGHGHVTPRPDGAKARCGGPALCHECARELAETGRPVRTGLSIAQNCEVWDVPADTRLDDDGGRMTTRTVLIGGALVPAARLRRIGWLDQLGRVWLRSADWDGKGGSLTPLLIDPGERR
jgi:hypothetical protein